jgi:hypothetical protein
MENRTIAQNKCFSLFTYAKFELNGNYYAKRPKQGTFPGLILRNKV